jgi:16S rRNA (uracil1498-N3)-methyltransferase
MSTDEARRRAAAHVFVDDLDGLVLASDDEHHLARSLRLRVGEVVTASDGRGAWRTTRWTGSGIEADGEVAVEPAAEPVLTVGFAPAKGDRPERVVRALTELGIDRLVPLTSARAVVRWDGDRARRHHDRLLRVAREAAMQSRRVWLPVVADVTPVGELVGAGAVLADPSGGPLSVTTPAVLVGPEGGWAPEELDGAPAVALGPTILRAETAAMAAGVLLADLRTRAAGTGRTAVPPPLPES